ncbi:hypothetical protein [Marinobacterium iners]|uniref:Uncharacterized protein n=1 Tax=Marinobacterium iners DSM 11526 TaxID=1122198 RepID=A0A1H4CTA7_9GAMM|nr:hypothetical protein [Marinobacterium iners]SEA63561.1 hypothetical protein SAMN02745729_105136 [Marinobacterium iners DSM 11526]
MTQRNFMAALDMPDEARETHTESAFVPVIETSVEEEKDTEAEIAAFVNRPDPTGWVEASSSNRISNDEGAGNTLFSEAAGFSNTVL